MAKRGKQPKCLLSDERHLSCFHLGYCYLYASVFKNDSLKKSEGRKALLLYKPKL